GQASNPLVSGSPTIQEGFNINYALKIINLGTNPSTTPIVFSFTMPNTHFLYQSVDPGNFTCAPPVGSPQTVTCTSNTVINPSNFEIVTMHVFLDTLSATGSPYVGTPTFTLATGTGGDTNIANNSTSPAPYTVIGSPNEALTHGAAQNPFLSPGNNGFNFT